MSKAFTKESDVEPEEPGNDDTDLLLPEGTKNYVTAAGLALLREELAKLSGAANARRMRYLSKRIETAEVVQPAHHDTVVFGSLVRVRDEDERERSYQLVGVDEADPKQGKISWLSPIAQALLGTRVGDAVLVSTPGGESELEVVEIRGLS